MAATVYGTWERVNDCGQGLERGKGDILGLEQINGKPRTKEMEQFMEQGIGLKTKGWDQDWGQG